MRLSVLLGLAAVATALGCSSGTSDNTCSSTSSALSVCAKGATVKGVDVSVYQGSVDWAKAKAAGIDFAIARVSDGTGNPDTEFPSNWPNMKTAGVVRAVYQFYRPSEDPIAQADLMLGMVSKAGGFQAGDMPAVMDIEVTDGLSPAQIQASMQKWLTYVETKTGRKPIIYTAAFMSSNVGTGFTAYPLWVANYGPSCPTMPSSWTQWAMWQYSDAANVNGISGGVDGDEFNGSLADLMAFADGPKPPTPDAGAPETDAGATGHDAGVAPPATHDAGSTEPPPNPCGP